MECDLGRLQIALAAATEALDEAGRFQMSLHGIRVKPKADPPRNAVEQDRRVKETFAALGTVKVRRARPAA